MLSLSQLIQAIDKTTYKLDLSGVVGLFGGENAVDALETIHLFAGRRWAGWYNYPGAATVAKRFGQMAEGRVWDSLFPGSNEPPEITFSLAGKSGPAYSGTFSGTELQTKYLGYLIAGACADYHSTPLQLFRKNRTQEARTTGNSAAVTIITLRPQQHERISRSLTMSSIPATKEKHEIIPIIPKRPLIALLAIVPSLISILAIALCLLGRDFLCASLVLFGILCSGFSSLALGTANLKIRVPVPSASSPKGDGLMLPTDGSIIILKGQEADVNIVTKGVFELDYSGGILPHKKHHTIGVTSLFLMAQFLVQLLLIPLCTLFGQITFLISFVASGSYHLYVVSREREEIQRELLLEELPIRMEKRTLGTRTQMVVFACLVLGNSDHRGPQIPNPEAVLSLMLPNKTPVWRYWKRKVMKELLRFWKWDPESPQPYAPDIQTEPEDQADSDEYSKFTEMDTDLLNDLIDDAWCVFSEFPKWRDASGSAGEHVEELEKVKLLPGGSLA